jgi:hypothetical protein
VAGSILDAVELCGSIKCYVKMWRRCGVEYFDPYVQILDNRRTPK